MDSGKIHIIHEMADGTILEEISGYAVPYNDQTAPAYHALYEIAERIAREQASDKA